MSVLRIAIRAVFRRIVRIYFRDIEVSGAVPDVTTRGRLFGANHVNGLVDPILVLTSMPFDVSPIAKATLFSIPGLSWLLDVAGAVPIIRRRDDPNKSVADNDAVFERIAAHLSGGGNILIFPEGTSHSEPHLAPLRTGAGRMLAAALAKDGPLSKSLTYQAVALEFDDRETFRSRAVVLYGPVRSVDPAKKQGQTSSDALVSEITETMRADLSELLVEGRTWDERITIARVAELYVNDGDDTSLARWNDVGRRIERARKLLDAHPDAVAKIEAALNAYYMHLRDARTSDDVVAGKAAAPLSRTLFLALCLPLALVGMVIYFLPYQLPRFVVKKSNPDRDVVSTYKLGVGLVAHPLWAIAIATAAFLRTPREVAFEITAALVVTPFAALAWLDDADRFFARLSILIPGSAKRAQKELREERARVMVLLEEVRARVEPG